MLQQINRFNRLVFNVRKLLMLPLHLLFASGNSTEISWGLHLRVKWP